VKTLEILRADADNAAARAIDVCDEHECNSNKQWHYHEECGLGVMRSGAEQHIGDDRNRDHHAPCGVRNPIPPRGLGIALRVQYIVHAGNGKRHYRSWLRVCGLGDCRPKFPLQLRGVVVDAQQLFAIACVVELNAQISVLTQQRTDLRRVSLGQQVSPDILGSDGVGFCFLVILS
jgi:hypothetical protein